MKHTFFKLSATARHPAALMLFVKWPRAASTSDHLADSDSFRLVRHVGTLIGGYSSSSPRIISLANGVLETFRAFSCVWSASANASNRIVPGSQSTELFEISRDWR